MLVLCSSLEVTKNLRKLNKMIIRDSIKGTICYVSNSVLFGRDTKCDSDCYLANSIHTDNDFNDDKVQKVIGYILFLI